MSEIIEKIRLYHKAAEEHIGNAAFSTDCAIKEVNRCGAMLASIKREHKTKFREWLATHLPEITFEKALKWIALSNKIEERSRKRTLIDLGLLPNKTAQRKKNREKQKTIKAQPTAIDILNKVRADKILFPVLSGDEQLSGIQGVLLRSALEPFVRAYERLAE
jgi:hypothetical protein